MNKNFKRRAASVAISAAMVLSATTPLLTNVCDFGFVAYAAGDYAVGTQIEARFDISTMGLPAYDAEQLSDDGILDDVAAWANAIVVC